MSAFLALSSLLGLATAVFGFYLSVRLDLPLGPTDVTLACAVIFFIYFIQLVLRRTRRRVAVLALLLLAVIGCSARVIAPLDTQKLGQDPLWIAPARNVTGSDLRLPSTNPLRSLAEIAGKVSPDYRPTVMDLLRGQLAQELKGRNVAVAFPDERDARLQVFPFDAAVAASNARSASLSGRLLLAEIRRWNADSRGLLRTSVAFRVVNIDSGAVEWEREAQKIIPLVGAARLDEASSDAVKAILQDIFGP
jgi:hypothetical protein